MRDNACMSLVDTLYDILSGIGGTLFGATVTYAINYRRNRRMLADIEDARNTINQMRAENKRLMRVIRAKEDLILDAEDKLIRMRRKK